jgi:hypothetical protein
MQVGSTLAPLSVLMKGDSLPSFTRWYGIPAEPVGARSHRTEVPLVPRGSHDTYGEERIAFASTAKARLPAAPIVAEHIQDGVHGRM